MGTFFNLNPFFREMDKNYFQTGFHVLKDRKSKKCDVALPIIIFCTKNLGRNIISHNFFHE